MLPANIKEKLIVSLEGLSSINTPNMSGLKKIIDKLKSDNDLIFQSNDHVIVGTFMQMIVELFPEINNDPNNQVFFNLKQSIADAAAVMTKKAGPSNHIFHDAAKPANSEEAPTAEAPTAPRPSSPKTTK